LKAFSIQALVGNHVGKKGGVVSAAAGAGGASSGSRVEGLIFAVERRIGKRDRGWVFLTKTAKSQFWGRNWKFSVTFRDKWRSFFNAIWRGEGVFKGVRTDGEKTCPTCRFFGNLDYFTVVPDPGSYGGSAG